MKFNADSFVPGIGAGWKLAAFLFCSCLFSSERLSAQVFTPLYSFGYSDGANPQGGLIQSGQTLYGTTQYGGGGSVGVVFSVNTDGTDFTNIYVFNNNGDGANPEGPLVLGGNTLYGTASYGGSVGWGAVFAVNTDGTGFTNIYSFTYGSDGATPVCGLVLSGNTLYGVSPVGGDYGEGDIFSVNTDGTGFTTLHSFSYGDGAQPQAGLVLSGSTLFGTTKEGGTGGGFGTIFSINTDGSGFESWYSFFGGSDGAEPQSTPVFVGDTLYVTTSSSGGSNAGTIFGFNTNTYGFSTVYTFTGGNDGGGPVAGLAVEGTTFYGTAPNDGASGNGTVFSVSTNGDDFTVLSSFSDYSDGSQPESTVVVSGLSLYGTANYAGYGEGTVYGIALPCPSISLPPSPLPNGKDGVLYEQNLAVHGGLAPYTYALAVGSSLPDSFTLSTDGVLSGDPDTVGDFDFSIIVTDANGCTNSVDYALNLGPSPLTALFDFATGTGTPTLTNADGLYPNGVVIVGDTLYGTAQAGGIYGSGSIFSVRPDGSGFTNIYSFTATSSNTPYAGTNRDGALPVVGLVAAGNQLYGVTMNGGAAGNGVIFSINADGTGFTNLYNFTPLTNYANGDGANPSAQLVISGNTLYGTASTAGVLDGGTVFSIHTDGSSFSNLYNFSYGEDGGYPQGGLVLLGNTLYGTAESGGDSGVGTLFSLNTDGSNFTPMYSFTGQDDGSGPNALIAQGNTLYGTTENGSTANSGAIFAVKTDGSDFQVLHDFSALGNNTNTDGAYPTGGLAISGSMLYGTAQQGGVNGFGTVFAVNTGGFGFTTLYDFSYFNGVFPSGALAYSDNTLYGTTTQGGPTGYGTLFGISTCPGIILSPATLASASVTAAYTQTFSALGGAGPYTYSVTSGALPSGLTLSTNGVLSGASSVISSNNFTIAATDANGCTVANNYSFNVFAHYTALHTFTPVVTPEYESGTNSDGASPYGGLVYSGNTLYGTASGGGIYGYGTVFAVNTDGSGFSNLLNFGYENGLSPETTLFLSGNALYGTTADGGKYESGTIFSINTDGSSFTNIYNFTGYADGYYPQSALILSGTTLYGAAQRGGGSQGQYAGVIFSVNVNGSGFTPLNTFNLTNGYWPDGYLALGNNTLYGATYGSKQYGTVFSVSAGGGNFATLHNFAQSDGAYPLGGVFLSGNTLYGTTYQGGSMNAGTLYSINVAGGNVSNIYNFSSLNSSNANGGGAYPYARPVLSGSTLYGTAPNGGLYGYGVVYSVQTNGTGFTTLYNFTGGSDGAYPESDVLVIGNTLYGTAVSGGASDDGVVYALSLGSSVVTIPAVVTWNTPTPLTYGSGLGAGQLDATANVAGNFNYTPPPGTIFSNVGTYALSVVFTPTDSGQYSPATNTVNLTVSRAPLMVTANNASRREFATNPPFSGTISGLVNGDAISASYSCAATYGSPGGTYPIMPALVDPNGRATNYTVTLVNGVLDVMPEDDIFNVIHNFAAVNGRTNSGGTEPLGGLTLSDNILYGTAGGGGRFGSGTVFSVNTSGSNFTTLYNFSTTTGCCGFLQNSDGDQPVATLALSEGVLYGVTEYGGEGYVGALFDIETNGTNFVPLHSFPNVYVNQVQNQDFLINSDGAYPYGGLVQSNGVLYGTSDQGGNQGGGVVFKVNTDGSSFTTLHDFSELLAPNYTNSDGSFVFAGLVLAGNTLYVATQNGGLAAGGTVFAIHTDSTGFVVLHNLTNATDGSAPDGALVLGSNVLYGAAGQGGEFGGGTIFCIKTNGTGFSNLYSFTALSPSNTNVDGAEPIGGLVLVGNILYGTASRGGVYGAGSIFAIHTDGTGFTNLYSFTGGADGASPESTMVFSYNTLYGTTASGGASGNGTLFSLSFLPPPLSISLGLQDEVILSWPTGEPGFSFSGFVLQSSPSLSPATWSTLSTTPNILNSNYTVVDFRRASDQFYRLRLGP